MKKCFTCNKDKNLKDFGSDKGKTDGKSTYCKECARTRDKEYYIKHRKSRYFQYRERRIRVARENAKKLWEYLKIHPCVDCKEKDILVLEFDHLRDKKSSISKMVINGLCWKTILEEIKKCEVVCSNCHARRTAKQQNWLKFLNGALVYRAS